MCVSEWNRTLNLKINGKSVGVQSICLEEDAAKLLNDEKNERDYSLDRLGIPLVEIALEPVDVTEPSIVRDIALTLGRLLRTTKKVKRGIGSIRQDVNISISGSGIVEVKGVQQLDQLEKIIEFEAKRLDGLKIISEKIRASDSHIKQLVGGVHATLDKNLLNTLTCVDYSIQREGEEAMTALVENKDPKTIPGVISRGKESNATGFTNLFFLISSNF